MKKHCMAFEPGYWLMLFSVAASIAAHAASPYEALPSSFDAPFAPQNINPDAATISLTPGFKRGRYDLHLTLAETTLYDDSHAPTRNYRGEFMVQGIKLPTDDFARLDGRTINYAANEYYSASIEFSQTPVSGTQIENAYGQTYPAKIKSIRFGPMERYALHAQIKFEVDFSGGPPHPWARLTGLNPYYAALLDAELPQYRKEDWDAFRTLVTRTQAAWNDAKYSTHVRVLLNHRYESSNGMNTDNR